MNDRQVEQQQRHSVVFGISIDRLTILLFLLSIGILFLDLWLYFAWPRLPHDIRQLIDITREGNIPTWFSSLLFLFCALVAFQIRLEDRLHQQSVERSAWLLIGLFFLFLSMDDASRFHERVGQVVGDILKEQGEATFITSMVSAFPSWNWQIVVLPFFILIAVIMVLFLIRSFQSKSLLFLFLAGLGLFTQAIILDYVDGLEEQRRVYGIIAMEFNLPGRNAIQHLVRAIEEFLEMSGTVLILRSFLGQWALLGFGPNNIGREKRS
ncbi:MAG: hypothetical protein HQL50_01710 [Magnetococcales bacterium]|nr:hypothetical protein [Magnetococcales bacterium]